MSKDKYCGEVCLELTFWLDVRVDRWLSWVHPWAHWLSLNVGTSTDQEGAQADDERAIWWTRDVCAHRIGRFGVLIVDRLVAVQFFGQPG